jgi:hypothetical protein
MVPILRVSSPSSISSIECKIMVLSKSPAEKPILVAVSILSPVRTQTLTPAALANSIVSAT